MDIKSVMSTFGFGHRGTNQIIIDHDGELWIAMSPSAVVGGLHVTSSGLPGTMRIEPLANGEYVPFSYTATESLLELTTSKGSRMRITTDREAQAIRITGDSAFRLNGVENILHSTITLCTTEGVVTTIGRGIRYLVSAKKGKISVDEGWNYKIFTSVTPVIIVEPEAGEVEVCVFDLPADTPTPPITKTIDECAAENSASFQAFLDDLVEIPPSWSEIKEMIAYPIWLCHKIIKDDCEVIVQNKYNSAYSDAKLMAIASMAFTNSKKAIDMILSYPVAFPPIAGVAVARLIEENLLNDSRGDIYRVCTALESFARMCVNERTVDNDGLSVCMYRFENGTEGSPAYFSVGEPVLTPDINAYLVIVSEVIGKLALLEYDTGYGNKWARHAKMLLAMLIAELWNGEDFIGKNAYTGETSSPDDFLSLVPIVLGSRLPSDIINKLLMKINEKATDSAVGLLLAGGLYDAGEKSAAKDVAIKALNNVRTEGIACPFYGASLLALAHKVLV